MMVVMVLVTMVVIMVAIYDGHAGSPDESNSYCSARTVSTNVLWTRCGALGEIMVMVVMIVCLVCVVCGDYGAVYVGDDDDE